MCGWEHSSCNQSRGSTSCFAVHTTLWRRDPTRRAKVREPRVSFRALHNYIRRIGNRRNDSGRAQAHHWKQVRLHLQLGYQRHDCGWPGWPLSASRHRRKHGQFKFLLTSVRTANRTATDRPRAVVQPDVRGKQCDNRDSDDCRVWCANSSVRQHGRFGLPHPGQVCVRSAQKGGRSFRSSRNVGKPLPVFVLHGR